MPSNVTVIGRTTRVRGRLTGAVDLEVQGFVEGEIAVSGDVTIDAQGVVGASVRGRRVVVRGAIKGDLVADEAIALEEGARVAGDLRAPNISIAQGAFVRGHVQTGEDDARGIRPAIERPAARPAVVPSAAQASARVAHAPTNAAVSPAVRTPLAAMASAKSDAKRAAAPAPPHSPLSHPLRRPPPPVVPALRNAKGQIVKKKER